MKKSNEDQIHKIRHSLSHLLATAVLKKFPETYLAIGPVIDNGFYYDFDFYGQAKLAENDLPEIEAEMKNLIKQNIEFTQSAATAREARAKVQGPYKNELIDDLEKNGEKITFYQSGEFTDLCAGPHVKSTEEIDPESFKLTKIAGAYWRGDEKNKMLLRIYGVAFPAKQELEQYLKMIEEAEKRDHRKIGKELDLFTFSELVGSGLPLYTPKGALIRRLLTEYIEELQSAEGYAQIWTPQIAKGALFKISGHYDKYKDNMFKVVSNFSAEEFYLKPMNCPQHTQVYASQMRSYRDLPLRYTDFAMLYRDEKPGELSGLARVRSFSQDDCHVFCREDQVDEEVDKCLAMTKKVMDTFGFKYRYRLSTHDPEQPEKYVGDPKTWEKTEKWAEKIMKRNKIEYFDGVGEAAFYAPKMDLMATDALGREWQLSTVQIDYFMPQKFDLTYIDDKGQQVHPIMIHRAIIGSPERFMMIILEHFSGELPLWLSPVQVKILSVGSDHQEFCEGLSMALAKEKIRVESDLENETVGNKIRKAAKEKIPYVLVIGDKEMQSDKLAVRLRGQKKLWEVSQSEFIEKLTKLIRERKNEL